jgi:hypothetical protein
MPDWELMDVIVHTPFGIGGDLEIGAEPFDFHKFGGRFEGKQCRLRRR